MLAEVSRGVCGTAPARMTLGEYLDRWYEAVRDSLRPHTQDGWRRHIQHWKAVLGSMPLAKLTPADVQAGLARLPGHLSDSSRQTLYTVLRAALNQAVRWGLLARSPAQGVKPPARERREMRVWDEEQAARFLEAARSTRYYALFHTALATGMRLGELLGLTWDDVDLEAGVIQVRRALATGIVRGDQPVWQEPKTQASRRRIPIDRRAAEVLRQHRRAQLEERLRAGPEWRDHNLVFANQTGGRLYTSNIWQAMRACERKAGVPRIRFHDLRHTHATFLLRQGVHPKVVSERLGHASVKITLDTYSHVLPDTQAEAVRAMERVFSAVSGGGVSKRLASRPEPGGRSGLKPCGPRL
jgi:integrase